MSETNELRIIISTQLIRLINKAEAGKNTLKGNDIIIGRTLQALSITTDSAQVSTLNGSKAFSSRILDLRTPGSRISMLDYMTRSKR